MPGTLLALSSSATAGKDTFFTLLSSHLNDRACTRVALADALKAELDPFFKAFGGTAFETDPVKKRLIRPVLVSYGCSQRTINPRYWIDKLEPSILKALGRDETVVLCDCRFENEHAWIKGWGGKVVYIERLLPDGSVLPPANEEETREDLYLRTHADVFVSWPTILTEDGTASIHNLWPFVEKAAHKLNIIA